MGYSPREKVGIQSMQGSVRKNLECISKLDTRKSSHTLAGHFQAWNGVPERSERVNGRGLGLGPGDRRSSGVGSRTRT